MAVHRPRPLPPTAANHVWAYDFVFDTCANNQTLKCLTVVDEWTRECLAIKVARRLNSIDVIETLADLFVLRGVPTHIRSDNGPEFVERALRGWLERLGVRTLYIEPGSPWENGYCESFNSKLRDEFLAREILYTMKEAKILIEWWRRHYNTQRPHSSLGYCPPAPRTILPTPLMPPYVQGVAA